MTINIAENQEEQLKILPYFIELANQHAQSMPHLFRSFDNTQDLMKLFASNFSDEFTKIEKGEDHFLYFEENNQIVAYAFVQDKTRDNAIFIKSHYLLLTGFIVDPQYRGQGIGKKCFTLLKSWAKNQGYPRLELTVDSHNPHAIALYQDMGLQKEMTYMSCKL